MNALLAFLYCFFLWFVAIATSVSSPPATILATRAAAQQAKFRAHIVSLINRIKQKNPDWTPNAIVDVGANKGDWSRGIRAIFPTAKLLLLEATPMHDTTLKAVVKDLGNAEYKIGVVSSRAGEIVAFYQGRNTGNSMFRARGHQPNRYK